MTTMGDWRGDHGAHQAARCSTPQADGIAVVNAGMLTPARASRPPFEVMR